jgi:Spy/CpxP family protein refolding chaperone
MRRSTAVALAALGVVTLWGGTVVAQQAGRPRGADLDRLKAEIGLSDEQVAAIRELRLQQRKAAITRRADRRVAQLELDQLLAAPTLDEAQVAAHVKTLADLESAAVQARVESQIAMRRAVSAEQYQKMRELRARMGSARAWRGQRWRHRGQPDGSPSGAPASPPA